MTAEVPLQDYGWTHQIPHTEAYLIKPLQQLLRELAPSHAAVLDLGCGNGALAAQFVRWGHRPIGTDPSSSGIEQAKVLLPGVPFYQCAADPAPLAQLHIPAFDVVVSTEVVEHVYAPRRWAAAAFSALKPGGVLICSTPYHGYLKNLTLAASGKLDAHFTALWDGGHIKFWSRRTLTALLKEAGFELVAFRGAGRWPWLWKSMLVAAWKPNA